MCVFNIVVPLPCTVWFQPDYSFLIYSIRPLACVSCELCATFIDVALPLRAAYSKGSSYVRIRLIRTGDGDANSTSNERESGPASCRSA